MVCSWDRYPLETDSLYLALASVLEAFSGGLGVDEREDAQLAAELVRRASVWESISRPRKYPLIMPAVTRNYKPQASAHRLKVATLEVRLEELGVLSSHFRPRGATLTSILYSGIIPSAGHSPANKETCQWVSLFVDG